MNRSLRQVRFGYAAFLALTAAFSTPAPALAVTGCTGTPLSTTYFTWFDNASPGMAQDNIHILNPDGTATSSGCVTVSGYPGVSWTAAAGQETYLMLPAGTLGGPVQVTVNSGPPVKASQRVHLDQSFSEIWAVSAAQAVTTSYFNWYDKASPSMYNDNVHLLNPGATSATVTVSVPGANPQTATVGAGAQAYVNFPQGSIGGPVTVTSSQPVLASQRVQYNNSFSEVWAASAAQAAATSYFSWYDSASPGMYIDNVHLLNPGTASANVTVSVHAWDPYPGGTQTVTVGAGAEVYVNFPGINGGPVKVNVNSGPGVVASQRVRFYDSLKEFWSSGAALASTRSYFNWYDQYSTGFYNDNIHVLNPGTVNATITVSIPYRSTTIYVGPGAQYYVSWEVITGTHTCMVQHAPMCYPIGGPVVVSSAQALRASQRVQYSQSFNEVPAN